MSTLITTRATSDDWEKAVAKFQPAWLAEKLVRDIPKLREHCDLGGYARLVFDLYVQRRSSAAWEFRNRLDELLFDGGFESVRWESSVPDCWCQTHPW
jgi:hypothetical protein